MRVCNIHGCGTIYPATDGGRCQAHRQQARAQRVDNRVYGTKGHRAFREAVLTRDTTCQVCKVAFSTVADHWPTGRRELVELGLDPNDPARGRGLCHRCHSVQTAANPDQRGGWARRDVVAE